MAIELIARPQGSPSFEPPGPLNLPPGFDRSKYVSKWVKEGQDVSAASERQWIPGSQLTADGWEVWKDTEGKPCKVPLSKGNFVLLFRLKTIQEAVNAICGNIGKERLLQEKTGETTGGVPIEDPGMLSDARIAKVIGKEDLGDGKVVFNKVPDVERGRIEAPIAQTAPSRRIVKRHGAE